MKHSEFTEKFHWMNGLSEYFRYTNQEQKYEPIFKALYHSNWYRKRDIIWDLINDKIDVGDNDETVQRAWLNMLLNEQMGDDIEVKPFLITTLLSSYTGDPFVKRICDFIEYFQSQEKKEDNKIFLPDLGDFLSRGQVKSKLWMTDELKRLFDDEIGTVVFFGGWYNFMAHFLFNKFTPDKVLSIDLDENVKKPCKMLYRDEEQQGKFVPLQGDVENVKWSNKKMNFLDKEANLSISEKVNLVINTSCEHMDNSWFESLPEGTMVVLQTNDYFSNPQHSNCCEDLKAAMAKYPMEVFLYTGELDTHLYNRFMLIGIK